MRIPPTKYGAVAAFVVIVVGVAIAVGLVTALLINISARKAEAQTPYTRLVAVTEDDTDPTAWGTNWPREYDSYRRTATPTRTRFGGHGGSEAMPTEKIERDPWLKRMFLGYAFAIDYRDRRGHAYMLADQEATKRLSKPQSGSCLHCHASVMPLYRKLGDGDAVKGCEQSYRLSYQELNAMLREMGHAHPVSCVDCHDPKTMQVRVARPGFIVGIRRLAESAAAVPALPSVQAWREGPRQRPYDPNMDASRTEMRSFVCGQCHVEYYCGPKTPLTFPWGKGLKAEDIEATWNPTAFPDGTRFLGYKHAETGAEVLKAREGGATEDQLRTALELQRQAQWRLDVVAAENSMGFHAPQEAARLLGEAADLARQGQVAALTCQPPPPAKP